MKNALNRFSSLLSAIRPFAIAVACALVLFANATPALAFGGSNSKPSDGLEQLDKVQKQSERAISGAKSAANDTRNVMKNAKEGLNGVQGRADKGNMKSPNSANARSIEGQIQGALGDDAK